MSRLVVTLALVVMFSVLVLAASAASGGYGSWEAAAPTGQSPTSYLGPTGLLITPTALIAPPLEGAAFYHVIESEPRRQAFWGATLGLPDGFELTGTQLVNVEPLLSSPGVFRSETTSA